MCKRERGHVTMMMKLPGHLPAAQVHRCNRLQRAGHGSGYGKLQYGTAQEGVALLRGVECAPAAPPAVTTTQQPDRWVLLLYIVLYRSYGLALFALAGAYYRTRLRRKYRIPGSFLCDLLLWCCCSPCAIAQEARHVDRDAGLCVAGEWPALREEELDSQSAAVHQAQARPPAQNPHALV
eukprot:g40132.t1